MKDKRGRKHTTIQFNAERHCPKMLCELFVIPNCAAHKIYLYVHNVLCTKYFSAIHIICISRNEYVNVAKDISVRWFAVWFFLSLPRNSMKCTRKKEKKKNEQGSKAKHFNEIDAFCEDEFATFFSFLQTHNAQIRFYSSEIPIK